MNNRLRALLAAIMFILVASSLFTVSPTFAESNSKPSIPEFSIKYYDDSYDVPEVNEHRTNPFDGRDEVYHADGYHVDQRTVEITIKNQPFVYDANSGIMSFYNIRFKGHTKSNWDYIPSSGHDNHRLFYASNSFSGSPPDPAHTTIKLMLPELFANYYLSNKDTQIDFQIQAFIGDETYQEDTFYSEGEASEWSNIYTVSIVNGLVSVTPSQNPIPSSDTMLSNSSSQTIAPTIVYQEIDFFASQWGWLVFGSLTGLGVVVIILLVFLVLLRKRIRVLELKQNGT